MLVLREQCIYLFLVGWVACCFAHGAEPVFLGVLGGQGWSWHQACWDRAVKPRIL